MTEVMVVAGTRTAIGDYGGAFKDVPPTKLGSIAIREALSRAKVDPASVGHVVMGSVIHGEARDMYLSRVAATAVEKGYFREQIVPVELKSKKGVEQFTTDEHVRKDASMENMAKLKPVFKKDGTVTAANASGINDAAAAIVLMEAKAAQRAGAKPIARLVAYAHAGVEPQLMGLGPIPAVKRVFEKAGR